MEKVSHGVHRGPKQGNGAGGTACDCNAAARGNKSRVEVTNEKKTLRRRFVAARFPRVRSFPWKPSGFHGYLQVSTDTFRFPRIPSGFHGYLQVSTDTFRFPRIPSGFHEKLQVSTKSFRFPRK